MRNLILAVVAIMLTACSSKSKATDAEQPNEPQLPVVYYTSEITPESLVEIFNALGVEPTGNVAIKISTGESEQTGYLRPDFIKPLIDATGGTIVECNTAYPGTRNTTEAHLQAIAERGFTAVAPVDIMDAEADMKIAVSDTTHIKYDIVGSHLANYDFMINLAHFKGHAMGGFGGVLKNASIGVASSAGKAYIHSAGQTEDVNDRRAFAAEQDAFLESMAAAAQGVHDYMQAKSTAGEPRIVYINVMNKMSVDCDCNAHPEAPAIKDLGIAASLDPVALDQACLDMVFGHVSTEGDDAQPLIDRINRQHGTYITRYAESIGLGSTKYTLVNLDAPAPKVLVAYYSATGTTEQVAKAIADATSGTLYTITPAEMYTDADLDWRDSGSRSSVEMNDPAARPALGGEKIDAADYDVVFVGFPIWWDLAPRVVNTWIETQNLSGKKVVPFATSGGSSITNSAADLRRLYPDVDWQKGLLLNDTSKLAEQVAAYID